MSNVSNNFLVDSKLYLCIYLYMEDLKCLHYNYLRQINSGCARNGPGENLLRHRFNRNRFILKFKVTRQTACSDNISHCAVV